MSHESIGIMGGTFDPIHLGHLVTAEEARTQFGLDKVLFVPSGIPPHKRPEEVTDAKHRFLMTVLATLTNPHFEVSRTDIERTGKTYTVDTLRDLRRVYGPDTRLYFISGADAILEILTWKDPEGILGMCDFIAATRPGFSLNELDRRFGSLYEAYRSKLNQIQVPAMAISSTDIRKRVHAGRPVRYLVPETVEYYIFKNNLYRDSLPPIDVPG